MSEKTGRPGKSNLVALGTATVLSIYGAGFLRTQAAAQRLDRGGEERRPVAPDPTGAQITIAPTTAPESLQETAAPSSPSAAEPAAPSAPAVVPVAPAAVEPAAEPAPTLATLPEPTAPYVPETVQAPAPAPVAPPVPQVAVAPPAPASKYKDGRYSGWGTSRHGDIQATVEIAEGRILSATITSCRTRYPCSRIDRIVPQVAERQSPEVDNVSRATQSSDAFYYAVLEALKKAQ